MSFPLDSQPVISGARATKWQIFHRTRYHYAAPVHESFNELRLQPVSDEQQTVDSFLLKVLPSTRLQHYRDFYSNCVHYFQLPEPHEELTIESHLQVTTHPLPGLSLDARSLPLAELKNAPEVDHCYDFVQQSRFVDVSPETWKLALDAVSDEDDAWQCALRIMQFTHGYLTYQSHSTHVHAHMREVLAQRCGVCQDFAHVMIGLCRSLRIPARYVSGYLATELASATHAWCEVFVPGAGWQALDPTHNQTIDETYVKIGVGRDYADVPPVSGSYKGTTTRTLTVEVRIEKKE